MEKGPFGKLPRQRLPGPLAEQGLQPQGEHHGGAVTLYFRGILPGIAVGRAGNRGQGLIDDRPVRPQQGSVDQPAVLLLRQGKPAGRAKDRRGGGNGAVAGQPQDPDGPGRRGGGDGGNGIGHGKHPFLFPSCFFIFQGLVDVKLCGFRR